MPVRIGRFLSQVGLCSRRNTATFLKENKVCFLERQVIELNFEIEESQLSSPVYVNDKKYYWENKTEVILLNKPAGYVCSHRKFKQEKSIMELVSPKQKNFFFAGRLDKESRGLIILSNDGRLIYELTHPSFRIKKIYHIHIKPPLNEKSIQKTLRGVRDKQSILKFDVLKKLKKLGHYEVSLHQGKNREIRRIMNNIGREVIDLKRIQIGDFILDDLEEGRFKAF